MAPGQAFAVGDWAWLSAVLPDRHNWLRKVETLGRVEAVGGPAWHAQAPLLYGVRYAVDDRFAWGWFTGHELWPCQPDEGEVAEWLLQIIQS